MPDDIQAGLTPVEANPNAPQEELPDAVVEKVLEGTSSDGGLEKAENEGAEKTETDKAEDAPKIDESSPFAPFQELRAQLLSEGVDMSVMDAKVANLEELSDEEVNLIATKGNFKPEHVKAYMAEVYKSSKAAVKLNEYSEIERQAFVASIDELAGGSYTDLISWIGANTPQAKVDLWNLALESKNPEHNKAAVKEMQAYRVAKSGEASGASLDLLTKSSNSSKADASPAQTPVDTLEGNPLRSLTLQQLCQVRMKPESTEQYELAGDVLKSMGRSDLI